MTDPLAGPFTFPDCDITLDNYDPTTGSCTIIITPRGAIGNVPPLAKGDAGPSPDLTADPNVTEVDWTSGALPAWTWTTLTPGSAGVAPTLRLNAYVRKGQKGDDGDNLLLSAADLVIPGSPLMGYQMTYVPADSGAGTAAHIALTAPRIGGLYWPGLAIADTSSANGPTRTLTQIGIAALPFAYRVIPSGYSAIANSGTSRADLIVRLNSATAGNEVGRGLGVAGSTAASPPVMLAFGPPAGSPTSTDAGSSYGLAPANTSATFFLRAEQQASTSDSFATAGATTRFCLKVDPIP